MKYTVLLTEGRLPKRCIGVFNTKDEAIAWAISDGWQSDQYKIMELWP